MITDEHERPRTNEGFEQRGTAAEANMKNGRKAIDLLTPNCLSGGGLVAMTNAMITMDEAIRLACEHIHWDGPKEGLSARLHTNEENHPELGLLFKQRNPALWDNIVKSHRDYWSVAFPNAHKNCFPTHFFVAVEVENGAARIIPAL